MQIRILTVGGTIDKIYFDASSTHEVGEPQVPGILKQAGVGFSYVLEPLMRKDSLEMTDEDRALLARRVQSAPERHLLITHGTDSMALTAEALQQSVVGKVVVLTGALLPALFRETDAPFNVGCALGALQVLGDGIYLAMNGRVFAAGSVWKNRDLGQFLPK